MTEEFPFEKHFRQGETEAVLFCDADAGGIQLFKDGIGNFLSVSVSWDGQVEITTCMAFPLSRLAIEETSLCKPGSFDVIRLAAHLGETMEGRVGRELLEEGFEGEPE